MRDAQATRRRLLQAASEEFAAHGIAGARVERIVASARSNKAQLYAYFTSKDLLFDTVFETYLDDLLEDVPLDGGDLGSYAVGIYDAVLSHPELVRLATWARLERVPTGHLFGAIPPGDAPKLTAIERAKGDGYLNAELDPVDILAMLTALALTWSPASTMIAASASDQSDQHERRRRALRLAVDNAFTAARIQTEVTS